MIPDKTTKTIDHANAVFARLDDRDGVVRDAARRERERLNAGLGRALLRVGIAVGVISLATIAIGLIVPIGMFGFLAAVGLAIGVAAVLLFSSSREIAAPNVTPDLPNAQMVQRFDSYLFRAQACPSRSRAGGTRPAIRAAAVAPPNAWSGFRTSIPMPRTRVGSCRFICPTSSTVTCMCRQIYRGQLDGEGISVDERLVEALSAGRVALKDITEKLARNDMAAFETQGRFIQSRYSEKTLED